MRKRLQYLSLLTFVSLFAGGCLLPADAGRPSLVVKEGVEQNYEMTEVKKGFIEKTKTVVATYQQVKKNDLSFRVNGKRIKALYVDIGSTVKKGDLLAELRMDEEEAQFLELSLSLETKQLEYNHLKEQEELLVKQLLRKTSASSERYQQEKAEIDATYKATLQDREDEITIMKMKYEKLSEQLAGGKLYAGMDGVVTQLSQVSYGTVSTAGKTVVTVSDSNVCAFESNSTELIPYFTVGETYVFTAGSGDGTYETILTQADAEKDIFRFEMKEPDNSLSIGLRVLYTLQTDHRDDVFYLPKRAVHTVNGNSYVFYIDETGTRRMKDVTIGLLADNEVEIVTGLSEGEEVILQ